VQLTILYLQFKQYVRTTLVIFIKNGANMKNKFKGLCTFGVFFGMWLSRNFGDNSYFGLNLRVLIGLAVTVLVGSVIILLLIKKQYLGAFWFFIIILPLAFGFVGMYYDDLKLVGGGLLAFFISLTIGNMVLKRYANNDDSKIDYDRYRNR
jgi:hypothetical protein